ncbi:MAG: hypothetical protein CMF39_03590 [Legionellaceae bacterium]|mgnify:CR=1 FL=1|nr:hypothetical protein [Legionellaceae bacterium]|tara:strand:+ start:1055 stop:2053 length:999 start_codon:yes stop_codon:yes gene_type:complete
MKEKIALIASYGLGDALLFLIIADNLYRNGYDATFYSNMLAQMQDWIPHVKCLPFPDALPEGFDLVMADTHSVLTKNANNIGELAKKVVFFSMANQGRTKSLCADHASKFSDKPRLAKLAKGAGVAIKYAKDGDIFKRENRMVQNVETFCREILKLDHVTSDNGITPPAHLIHRQYKKRIILHPLSSTPERNWSADQYIELAKQLKKRGFNPVFITSPQERDEWIARVKDDFELPLFPSIADLAAYVYESDYMIGNESGIGHLASNLGLPTLSIYRKRHHYQWQPNWTPGIAVKPSVLWRLFPKHAWRRFISVRRVLKAFLAHYRLLSRRTV